MIPNCFDTVWLFREIRPDDAYAPDDLILAYNDERRYKIVTLPAFHDIGGKFRDSDGVYREGINTNGRRRWCYAGKSRHGLYVVVEPDVTVGDLKIVPSVWTAPVVLCDPPAMDTIKLWLTQLNQTIK